MKIILALIFIGYVSITYSQCQNNVTIQNGVQNIDNVSVSVSSFGMVGYGSNCANSSPYLIGRTGNNYGDGGYSFNFLPSINSLTLNFDAINNIDAENNEEIELLINGDHYNVTSVGQINFCNSSTITLPIITPNGYIGDSQSSQWGSASKNLTINESIESLTVVSHVVGIPFGVTFSLRICTDPLSIAEYEFVEGILSPNPFIEQSELHLSRSVNSACVTIYNSLGQVVKIVTDVSTDKIIIDRENLPNGIYILQLKENEKIIFIDKIIVQ